MPSLVRPVLPPGQLGRGPQPVIRSGPVVLRPWAAGDTDAVVAAYTDPDIQRWHVRSMTREEAVGWIRDAAAAWEEERAASWAVEVDRAVVGRMTLRLRLPDGSAEAAYWVVPEARGRGFAVQALEQATRWALACGFHRVELEHSTRNGRSCRVALRAGFPVEDTRREAVLHADGWHDMHVHARTHDAPDPARG